MKRGLLTGALCATIAAAIYYFSPSFLGAEWWLFDSFSRRLARDRDPDPRIVLVTISDQAVRNLSEIYARPPYSREVWATVVEELRRNGAAVIAFDTLFNEENDEQPEGDRAFAAALAGSPVILSAQTTEADQPAPFAPDFADKLWAIRGPVTNKVYKASTPHPMFRDAAGIGTIRLSEPTDSATVHRTTLAHRVAGGYLPSLALECARQRAQLPREASWVPSLNEARFSFGKERIPVNDDLEMLIRWNGTKAKPEDLSYDNVGLDKVLLASMGRAEGAFSEATLETFALRFRGKFVIIGNTAAGLLDLRATPLSPISPGLEIHANALDNLINGDFNRVANRWLMIPLILLAGAAFGTGIDRMRSQLVSAIVVLVTLTVIVAIGYGALATGLFVPSITIAVGVALTYAVITVLKFIQEQEQSAVLPTTFGRYVSPQILQHILAHPEKVRLGGERRDLTILFSGIRGFTSISEASEPEEVVEMLNEYLTRMVDILLAHGGTLDKFIGDAVMGFWNAPAFDPDHPRKAVACAVAMIDETARLRQTWEARGKAVLRIGIGINTGEAVVGNIGSERVFGYTVIGDAVNLASRLEGKNKDYGTEIIISEFTLARMKDEFETVYLDEVKVKGKERAVKIYEVKGTR